MNCTVCGAYPTREILCQDCQANPIELAEIIETQRRTINKKQDVIAFITLQIAQRDERIKELEQANIQLREALAECRDFGHRPFALLKHVDKALEGCGNKP